MAKAKKPASKMRNPLMSYHATSTARGQGSKYRPSPKLSKRKVITVPKGVKRDKHSKSGGIDITELLKKYS